ncbi:unnamed protein product [Prorocentrum cordatum]|uniref:WW domain-containing protein n=1 Tax=Prorocentrum cordatum TaxID=2364126 RepID=A0ABN9TRN9_9DINO|nr:unnamed protein product [Polarella glacialis]
MVVDGSLLALLLRAAPSSFTKLDILTFKRWTRNRRSIAQRFEQIVTGQFYPACRGSIHKSLKRSLGTPQRASHALAPFTAVPPLLGMEAKRKCPQSAYLHALQTSLYIDNFDKTILKRLKSWFPLIGMLQRARSFQEAVQDSLPLPTTAKPAQTPAAAQPIAYMNERAEAWAARWTPSVFLDPSYDDYRDWMEWCVPYLTRCLRRPQSDIMFDMNISPWSDVDNNILVRMGLPGEHSDDNRIDHSKIRRLLSRAKPADYGTAVSFHEARAPADGNINLYSMNKEREERAALESREKQAAAPPPAPPGGAAAGAEAVEWVEIAGGDGGARSFRHAASGEVCTGPPPSGWVELLADGGARYYWHVGTQTTQWERPR